MKKINWGAIGTIILAIGTGVMSFVGELNSSRREEQLDDLIGRVEKYLPKINEEET